MTEKNLYDQLYELQESMGDIVNDTPEFLIEIQTWIDCEISHKQIRKILKYVPDIFSEDWKCPLEFSELSDLERSAYNEILTTGDPGFPRSFIQNVIELGIEYRSLYRTPISNYTLSNRELLDGEYIAIPTDGLANNYDFMDALYRFQFGSRQESEIGFEEMKKIASKDQNNQPE